MTAECSGSTGVGPAVGTKGLLVAGANHRSNANGWCAAHMDICVKNHCGKVPVLLQNKSKQQQKVGLLSE